MDINIIITPPKKALLNGLSDMVNVVNQLPVKVSLSVHETNYTSIEFYKNKCGMKKKKDDKEKSTGYAKMVGGNNKEKNTGNNKEKNTGRGNIRSNTGYMLR